jgi:putative nucleotidyltransferase with HDIG domain
MRHLEKRAENHTGADRRSAAAAAGSYPYAVIEKAELMPTTERILFVGDEKTAATTIGAALERGGFAVTATEDPDRALRFFAKAPSFEVVLLDAPLPAGDSLALLQTLKTLSPELRVVMVSGANDIHFAVRAMKKGAYDFLPKPVGTELLVDTLRRAFADRENDRELDRHDRLHRQSLERLVQARTELLHGAIADLERSYDITLEALGNALDLKDAETEGHSKRVTAYSIVLARAMKLEPAEVKIIARGAFLHDIGKMAIPDAILSKPGKLTAEEQAVMREHCVRGYTMLKKIPFLQQAAEIVFSHQEHFDGSGYCRGLKGEEIPLGARIFSISDALDAITSDRPYRRAKSFAEARAEIERCSGTQFDPAIVAVYRSLPDKLWTELRAEINLHHGDASLALSESLRDS